MSPGSAGTVGAAIGIGILVIAVGYALFGWIFGG